MAETKTPWLTYALLGGAAYVAYILYNNYQTQQAAAAATPAGSVPGTTPVQPALPAPGGQVINNTVMSPVPSQQLPVATLLPTGNGITQSVYSVVNDWAQQDGRAPVLVFAAADIPSEYAGMYDIITNYWDKNIAPGPTQTQFWNALRAKYDPGDAIW
jgi:hypothetical protein